MNTIAQPPPTQQTLDPEARPWNHLSTQALSVLLEGYAVWRLGLTKKYKAGILPGVQDEACGHLDYEMKRISAELHRREVLIDRRAL